MSLPRCQLSHVIVLMRFTNKEQQQREPRRRCQRRCQRCQRLPLPVSHSLAAAARHLEALPALTRSLQPQ